MARCVNGHEVLAGDRFCGRCGWAVPAHCPYGHPAQPDHVYCKECGAPVGRAAQPALVAGASPQPPAPLPAPVTPAHPPLAPAAPAPVAPPLAPTTWPAVTAPPGLPPDQQFDPLPGPTTWLPPGPGPGAFAAAPRSARGRGWGSGARSAAVVAAVLVLVAAGLGIAAGATAGGDQGSAMSSVPGVMVPSSAPRAVVPSYFRPGTTPSTTEPSSAEPPSSEPPSTASPPAPTSSALTGLRPLVGDWNGHGGGVHIGADGQGQATFRAYRFCTDDPTPPCDTMNGNTIVDGGHAQFRLTAARAPGAATGRVTSSDDPEAFQPGFVMTVSVTAGDVMLVSSSPTAQSVAYCGSRATAGACGA